MSDTTRPDRTGTATLDEVLCITAASPKRDDAG